MIELRNGGLAFNFPHLGEKARCTIEFERTLRIPDTGQVYGLPPGLGRFPLRHLDDLAGLPAAWAARGGVAMPMWQAEAMWISFYGDDDEDAPFAVKIAAGKINAVTGEPWREGLSRDPQDYLALPDQPWLDGFCVAKGEVRQFVAMRLGQGFSAEEQVTGAAQHGGLQISVTPLTADAFARWGAEQRVVARELYLMEDGLACASAPAAMGLAAGGRMRQHIYPDRRPLADWDIAATRRVFVTLLDAVTWRQAAGAPPPFRPPTAADYADAGLPWFDWYGEDAAALGGAKVLAGLKSVGQLGGLAVPDEDFSGEPRIALGPRAPRPVREPAGL